MNLLVHWQYFKRCNFMEVDWRFPSDSELHHLKPYQFKFMKTTVEMLKKRGTWKIFMRLSAWSQSVADLVVDGTCRGKYSSQPI